MGELAEQLPHPGALVSALELVAPIGEQPTTGLTLVQSFDG